MSNRNLGLSAVVILGIGGYFVYKEYKNKKSGSDAAAKIADVDLIVTSDKTKNRAYISLLNADYVKAWADGIRKPSETFEYKGKSYYTLGKPKK